MKSKNLKIIIFLITLLAIIGVTKGVKANSINSLDMDIYIDNNGNAEFTEIWQVNTNKGTEVYHPYYNLGNSTISNLRVYDKNRTYTTLNSWNTSGSLSSKAYQCGINRISNGVELCWGISEYGSNTYTVKYNISNFVSELTDCQMIYWNLIPYDFSETIGSSKIRIHADKHFADTIDVWGYGKYGALCYVSNGAIYMDTEGNKIKSSEYMTLLAKFPKETFNTSNFLDYDFNYYYNMAQDGAETYNGDKQSFIEVFFMILSMIIWIVPWIIAIIVGLNGAGKKFGFKYGKPGKRIKDAAYYRDIPCNKDIYKTYYIAYQYNIMKKKTDILGAIILKWLKQGIIKTEQRDGGKIFKKENTVILLGDEKHRDLDNAKETKLFKMMYEASKDGILENKEFERWCRKSYDKILDWFDDILEEQRENLVKEGLIIYEKSGFWGKKYTATPELKQEAEQIEGLKKFLLDYTLIQERKDIEVEIFEEYLIYAQLLGIAKKVSKQFKELYPDMIEQTNYASYDNIVYINYCASSGISSANSARAAAQSYNSGGGGFSSGGGGGGSFGGGGGRRRLPLKHRNEITNTAY